MQNKEIRERANQTGVKHWQIAERLGIGEYTLSKMLRKELDEEKKKEILRVIDELSK